MTEVFSYILSTSARGRVTRLFWGFQFGFCFFITGDMGQQTRVVLILKLVVIIIETKNNQLFFIQCAFAVVIWYCIVIKYFWKISGIIPFHQLIMYGRGKMGETKSQCYPRFEYIYEIRHEAELTDLKTIELCYRIMVIH